MALQLPNIYTFGQVQLDTQPLAQLQGKLLAQQEAKQEALNKYFEKRMGDLSREGIADNDVKDWNADLDELKTYWKSNANDIKKGGEAKLEFDKRIEKLKNLTYQSKEKKKNAFEFRKQFQFGNKNPTRSDMQVLDYIELPIRDPKRINPATGVAYNVSDFSTQVPAFDVAKRNTVFSQVSAGIDPSSSKLIKTRKLKSGDVEEDYEITYSPKQIKFMQDKYVQSLPSDRAALNYYENILSNPKEPENAARLKALNGAWVKSNLHQGDMMDTPEDLAKADILLEFYLRPPKTETKRINMPLKAGGTTPVDADIRPFLIFPKYTANIFTLPDGRKAVPSTEISHNDLSKIKVTPEYIGGKDYYIVESGGVWRGEGGQRIVDEDLAVQAAPSDIRESYLKKKISGGKPSQTKKTTTPAGTKKKTGASKLNE